MSLLSSWKEKASSFLSPSPFQEEVDRATSEFLLTPDWDKNISLVDQVNLAPVANARELLRALRKRTIPGANAKVQYLALALLEMCTKNCNSVFLWELVQNRDLQQDVVRIASQPARRSGDREAQVKALELLASWQSCRVHPQLRPLAGLYDLAVSKGANFDGIPVQELTVPTAPDLRPVPVSNQPFQSPLAPMPQSAPGARPYPVPSMAGAGRGAPPRAAAYAPGALPPGAIPPSPRPPYLAFPAAARNARGPPVVPPVPTTPPADPAQRMAQLTDEVHEIVGLLTEILEANKETPNVLLTDEICVQVELQARRVRASLLWTLEVWNGGPDGSYELLLDLNDALGTLLDRYHGLVLPLLPAAQASRLAPPQPPQPPPQPMHPMQPQPVVQYPISQAPPTSGPTQFLETLRGRATSILPSPFQEIVDVATSEFLVGPNLEQNIAIVDVINAAPQANSREALRAIRKRLQSSNPKVQYLSLELLEMCCQNCGTPLLWELVQNKDLQGDVLHLALQEVRRPGSKETQVKALQLISSWQSCSAHPQLGPLGVLYAAAVQRGANFDGIMAQPLEFDQTPLVVQSNPLPTFHHVPQAAIRQPSQAAPNLTDEQLELAVSAGLEEEETEDDAAIAQRMKTLVTEAKEITTLFTEVLQANSGDPQAVLADEMCQQLQLQAKRMHSTLTWNIDNGTAQVGGALDAICSAKEALAALLEQFGQKSVQPTQTTSIPPEAPASAPVQSPEEDEEAFFLGRTAPQPQQQPEQKPDLLAELFEPAAQPALPVVAAAAPTAPNATPALDPFDMLFGDAPVSQPSRAAPKPPMESTNPFP